MASVEEVFPASSPVVSSVANFLEHVLSALKLFDTPEKRLQQFMPEPLKTEECLRRVCALATSDISSRNLLEQYMKLAVLEKSFKYPALQLFLGQRATIARHFLSVPILAILASPISTAWKRLNGYRDEQSWLYLEYSEPRVRDWIHEQMPRCASHRTNQIARWMDDIDRMARANEISWDYSSCTLEDVKKAGLWNEEWVDDNPLAPVALDLIGAQNMKLEPLRTFRSPTDEYWIPDISDSDTDTTETTAEWRWTVHKCLKPFISLKQRHESLQFASIRLIGLKLLDYYTSAPYEFSEELQQALKPFQSRCRLKLLRHFLACSVSHITVELSYGLDEHIEDLLEDARALLDSGQVCDCCASSFKAIVECSRVYAFQLAKRRLCHLAKCVLLSWKKPDFNKLWIDTSQPPFPAPVLDEIENCRWSYNEPDKSALTESLPSFEYIVTQYRKAKDQGLVSKHEDYKDLVVKTAVQVLDMAEAQLSKKPEVIEGTTGWEKRGEKDEGECSKALESRHEEEMSAKVKELTLEEALESRHAEETCERGIPSLEERIKVLKETLTTLQESHASLQSEHSANERLTRDLTEFETAKDAQAAEAEATKPLPQKLEAVAQITEQHRASQETLDVLIENKEKKINSPQQEKLEAELLVREQPESFQASTSNSKKKVATWITKVKKELPLKVGVRSVRSQTGI